MPRRRRRSRLRSCALALTFLLPAGAALAQRSFYVRQTLGDDRNDGLARERAWASVSKLSRAMRAGDVAYVGPGLYRDQIVLASSGTEDAPIRILGDAEGLHTGDPPGLVLISGSDPVDEGLFVAHSTPGVFRAKLHERVVGAVEMDGEQYRYRGVLEPLSDVPYLAQVEALPGSLYWDPEEQVLYLHTRDGRHPSHHELELIRRSGGVSMTGARFVVVAGFTFRHQFDAGIGFSTGSSHGAAMHNTVWGGRQGIRVNGATDVVVVGNTLVRNENSGVYFMNGSFSGAVIGNTLYENAKGARWSSDSNAGLAIDNVAYDNLEAGIALENVSGAVLLRNRLSGNRRAQLLAIRSGYHGEANCFERGRADHLLADLHYRDRYSTLADYQRAKRQDLGSHAGSCGPTPAKLDVRDLHARSQGYLGAARRRLGSKD